MQVQLQNFIGMIKYTVKFARGPKSGFNLYTTEQKKSIVYFAEDTKEILVNNVTYGINLSANDVNLISQVEMTSVGTIIFTKTNGSTITISIPLASQSGNGLLSKEDKKIIDEIPTIYATKDELNGAISKVYRFKGTKQYFTDLPAQDQVIGDAYNILNGFDLGGKHYNNGTNVAWDGTNWDPLGGDSESYTKLETDNLFVAWTVNNNVKIIKLPSGSRIVATSANNSSIDLIRLNDNQLQEQVEIGDSSKNVNINSSGRPTVILSNNNEKIAFLSDIGHIDISTYGVNAKLLYFPKLTQEFINENGWGDNLDGEPVTGLHEPVIGKEIVAVIYPDNLLQKHIDWFTPEKIIPNAVHAAFQGIREEYLEMLTWVEVQS